MQGLIYAPAAMIADAITRAVENIIGGRLKVVDVKTTAARIAGILVTVLGPVPVIHAVMAAAR